MTTKQTESNQESALLDWRAIGALIAVCVLIGLLSLASYNFYVGAKEKFVELIENPPVSIVVTTQENDTTEDSMSGVVDTTPADKPVFSPPTEPPIIVVTPLEGETIASPLFVSGFAPGTWFFEGDAPLMLTNWDGLIISESYITAEEDWMTEDFIPFSGRIEFSPQPSGSLGALIFHKDNPSDLPQFDEAHEIPIAY